MNDFENDDKWQRRIRDKLLLDFYGKHTSPRGRFVLLDKGELSTLLQRRFAIDTIVQTKGNRAIGIEEKIVRWPKDEKWYDSFTLETESCTVPGRESPGWMRYSQADLLFYCCVNKTETGLRGYMINFRELQTWFLPIESKFREFVTTQINRTRTRIVPIESIKQNVKTTEHCLGTERHIPSQLALFEQVKR